MTVNPAPRAQIQKRAAYVSVRRLPRLFEVSLGADQKPVAFVPDAISPAVGESIEMLGGPAVTATVTLDDPVVGVASESVAETVMV
jgi:hypothetical protein